MFEKFKFLLTTLPEAALILVEFNSKIGYLLDEIPLYSLDLVKNYIIIKITNDQWLTKIKMQIIATNNRQIYRMNYF